MVNVALSVEEAGLLQELLGGYLTDLRREVAGTENPDFRHTLQRRERFLEDFLQRLAPEPALPSPAEILTEGSRLAPGDPDYPVVEWGAA